MSTTADGTGSTGTTSTTSTTASGGSIGDDSSVESIGDPPPVGEACDMSGMFGTYAFSLPTARYASVDPTQFEACNDLSLVDPEGVDDDRLNGFEDPDPEEDNDDLGRLFDIWVYRPDDGSGGWPDAPEHPVVFFSPGGGLRVVSDSQAADYTDPNSHYYRYMFQPLAEAGAVVVAVEPASTNWSSGRRRAALACAMLWIKDDPELSAHTSNNFLVAGHSRGGAAAWLLTKSLYCSESPGDPMCCFSDNQFCSTKDDLPSDTELADYDQCGFVSIAPRFHAADALDKTDTNVPMAAPDVPPMLTLVGSIDNDTKGQAITAFDHRVSEAAIVFAQNDENFDVFDETLILAYGPVHTAWGGVDPSFVRAGSNIAERVGAYYIEQFLRWKVYHEENARVAFVALSDPATTSDDFPDALADEALWNTNALGIYYKGCDEADPTPPECGGVQQPELQGFERPLVFAMFTQGISEEGAGRFVVDTFENGFFGCDSFEPDLSPSITLGDVFVAAIGNEPVMACKDDVGSLLHGFASDPDIAHPAFDFHDGRALRVSWGGELGGAEVEWSLVNAIGQPLAVGDLTHFSFRVGNVLEELSDIGCSDTYDEFAISVSLESENGMGGADAAVVEVPRLIDRHSVQTSGGCAGGNCCYGAQFAHTVRVPLKRFCDALDDDPGALDPSALTAIRFTFEDMPTTNHVIIDSLEFTRDPANAETEPCPQATGLWNCAAKTTLVPHELACDTEPVDDACPSGHEVSTAIDLPWVANPSGGGFSGWVVYTPKGWIDDPHDPSQSEVDDILVLCVAACELEYADHPDVAIDCAAPGAFDTPTLRKAGAYGPVHRIPNDREHGEGIFGSEVLACDLEDDCCEAFDEVVCAAKALRATEAKRPLARAEEYRGELGGSQSKITLTTPGDNEVMSISGTVGYSFCAAGDTGTTCPFYLGSLELSGTNPVTITDTCPDSTPIEIEVSELDLRLLQPAFGVASAASYEKAMPEGALHVLARVTVDGHKYGVRAVNENLVFMNVDAATGFAIDGAVFAFDVPCGLGALPVTVTIDLDTTSVLARPPAVTITTPSQVTCPDTLAWTANASDPDGDLESVRWYADDVLIAPGTASSIPITKAHELRVWARDERGAATTNTKVVSCAP